jgi:hypothetical protein
LPKPSTHVTTQSMRPRRTRAAGKEILASRSAGVTAPRSPIGFPLARCAAAGAKMSRPWNVLDKRLEHHLSRVDHASLLHAAETLPRDREQPVVRPDHEGARGRLQREREALAADAGIDDGKVHRLLGHVRNGAAQRERPRGDVLTQDRVRQVDHVHVGRDSRDHAVTDADELVVEAVVREEHDGFGRSSSSDHPPPRNCAR